MFTHKKYILFFRKTMLRIFQVSLGAKPEEKFIIQYPWTNTSLPNVLQTVRQKIGSHARILLDESFVYEATIFLPNTENVTREIVQENAQEMIPENLNNTVWDFKAILVQQAPLKSQTAIVIQVIALTQPFSSSFTAALHSTHFVAETIEPVSTAIARIVQSRSPLLVIHGEEIPRFTMIYNGLIVATETVATPISDESIKQFIAFVSSKYHITTTHILFSTNTSDAAIQQLEKLGYTVEVKKLSPVVSLAIKKDIAGRNEHIFNLGTPNESTSQLTKKSQMTTVSSPFLTEDAIETNTHSQRSSKIRQKPVLFALLAFGLLIVTLSMYLLQKKQSDGMKRESTTKQLPLSVTQSPTPTLKPTTQSPTIPDTHVYTITVLNGSGKSGEATNLATYLAKNGYTVTTTGNAKTNNYETTEIHYANAVTDEFKASLDKIVKILYANSIDINTQDSTNTDVTIIIGK